MAKVRFPSFLESEFKTYFIGAKDLFLFAITGAIAKTMTENEVYILLFSGGVALSFKILSSLLPRGFFTFYIFSLPRKFKSLLGPFHKIKLQVISTLKRNTMDFPIVETKENMITVRSGDTSLFYELLPPDLEQLTPNQKEDFYNQVIQKLGRLPENEHLKFYYFNERVFLSARASLSLPLVELKPCSAPLKPIFNSEDFYTDILIFEDYFKANFKYHRIISINSFPSHEVSECHLMHFGNFTIFFEKIAKTKAESSLGKQISINTQGSNSGKNDLVSGKTFDQATHALSEIIDGTLCYFKAEIAFFVEAETLIELNQKSSDLLKNLKDEGYTPLLETLGLRSILYRSIPGVPPLFKNPLTDVRSRKMPTDFLANLLPLNQDILDSEGIEFFSRSGLPITFNPLSKNATNFNMIISGQSGQGKSFLACALVEYFFKQNVKLIVLDKGQSFVRLARYYNATNFSHKFNPVQFKDPDYLKAFVMSVLPKADFGERKEGILYKCIKDALKAQSINTFEDLLMTLKEHFPEIENYFEEIRPYFTNEESLVSSFTYLDTTLVPKKLLAPLMIFLMKLTRSLSGTKRFVIDEAWDVLGTQAHYVAQMARESRKEGLGLITITQNLKDFFRDGGSELAQIILENSNYKISLKQDVPEEAKFSSYEEEIIKNLNSVKDEYSEFAIFSNRSSKVARFISTCLQYELFNTEDDRKENIEKWLKDHLPYFSYAESMDRFVRVTYA